MSWKNGIFGVNGLEKSKERNFLNLLKKLKFLRIGKPIRNLTKSPKFKMADLI